MKYIIMCGGNYGEGEHPRQLITVKGEPIVARTIRLLKENGIDDIAISSGSELFDGFGVPRLTHDNDYVCGNRSTFWIDAFYPMEDPVCYLFGDVVYSPWAIQKIIRTRTESIQYFASAPPYHPKYVKHWAEPFALKVSDTILFRAKLRECKELANQGAFKRGPIIWELWQVIKGTPLNRVNFHNYIIIDDYTCDIDTLEERDLLEELVGDDL